MIESNKELDFIIKMETDNIINRLFKLGTVFDFQKFIIKLRFEEEMFQKIFRL